MFLECVIKTLAALLLLCYKAVVFSMVVKYYGESKTEAQKAVA